MWEQAACIELGTGPFFVEPADRQQTDRAKEVCAGCVVRAPCLEYALENSIGVGVWGGLDQRERSALLRRRAEADGRTAGLPSQR